MSKRLILEGSRLAAARETLCLTMQLLRGWHEDGTPWSDHDRDVERQVAELQQLVEEASQINKKPYGECVIDAVVRAGAVESAIVTDKGTLFVWRANAPEQIEAALVEQENQSGEPKSQ